MEWFSPEAHGASLAAFLDNFCAAAGAFAISPDAGGIVHTAQIQPSVFFTFEAPFVRILALYSNTLEEPGVSVNNDILALRSLILSKQRSSAIPMNTIKVRRYLQTTIYLTLQDLYMVKPSSCKAGSTSFTRKLAFGRTLACPDTSITYQHFPRTRQNVRKFPTRFAVLAVMT